MRDGMKHPSDHAFVDRIGLQPSSYKRAKLLKQKHSAPPGIPAMAWMAASRSRRPSPATRA